MNGSLRVKLDQEDLSSFCSRCKTNTKHIVKNITHLILTEYQNVIQNHLDIITSYEIYHRVNASRPVHLRPL